MSIFYEIESNIYMFNLFYVCINLSRCTVIPNSKQISHYVEKTLAAADVHMNAG